MRLGIFFLFLLSLSGYAQTVPLEALISNGNNVSVVNVATNSVTQTIVVGAASPGNLAITPNGSFAYVTDVNGNVSVINLTSNIITATIPIGGGTVTLAICITPNGSFAYAANEGSNNVSVINLASNIITATVSIGASTNPTSIAAAPNGSFVYVVNSGGVGTVSVISTTAPHLITATIPINTTCKGIAITPNGSFAYVLANINGNVAAINLTSNIITATIGTSLNSPINVAITPNGSFAYVVNNGSGSNSNVSVINIATNIITATVPVGSLPTQIAITPNGSFAYVTNNNSNNVSVINLATNSVTTPLSLNTPSGVAITPSLPTTSPSAPLLVTVSQQRNVFPNQTDLYTVVNWTIAGSIATYTNFYVYRDPLLTNLAATLSTNTSRFEDHNLTAGQTYSYYVVGYTQLQGLIPFGNATITIAP